MKRLLIILVLLPSVAFGQSAFVNCVDSIYAMYAANLSHPPNPTQAAQMVAMASKTCRCMSSYIGDTTAGGGGLSWSDTLTYIATRYYVLTHGGSTDSTVYSTKAWRQKGIDSINANYYLSSNPSAFISQVNNVYGTLITSYNDIAVDTSKVASHYFVTSSIHDSLPNLSGYFPTADTTYLFRKADSNTNGHAVTLNYYTSHLPSGTVTSVAGGRGITGGTITSTGTLGLDTTQSYTWVAPQTESQSGIAATPTDALIITNTTSATSSVKLQYSPNIHWHGTAWNTTALASQPVDFIAYVAPVSSTSVAGNLHFQASANGGAYSDVFYVSSAGNVTMPGTLSVTSTVTLSGNLNSNATTTIGGKMNITSGSNKAINDATLSSGTVTVSNTTVTASSNIIVQYKSGSSLSGAANTRMIRVSTITAGTSFVIVAESAPGTTNTSDNSTVTWQFVN